MLRLLTNFILFGSVLFLPWWFTIMLALVAIFKFSSFYEIIGWGLFADMLYGTGIALFYNFGLFLSFGTLIMFVAAQYLKSKIRFYQ